MPKYKFTNLSKPAINPYYFQVRERTKEWVKKNNLLDLTNEKTKKKFERLNSPLMASLMHPTAKLDHLQLLSDYFTWVFIIDDVLENSDLEEVKYITSQFKYVLNEQSLLITKSNQISGLLVSLQELLNRFYPNINKEWKLKFIKVKTDYLDSVVKEIDYKVRKEFPTIKKYIPLRRDGIAAFPFIVLADMFKGISFDVFENERLEQLRNYAADNMGWVNDYFSYEKEKASGDIANYVLVVEKEKGWSEEQAKDYVFQEIERTTSKFNEIYQQIRQEDGKEEHCVCAEGLMDWMTGQIEWFKYSGRYTDKEHYLLENLTEQSQLINYYPKK